MYDIVHKWVIMMYAWVFCSVITTGSLVFEMNLKII